MKNDGGRRTEDRGRRVERVILQGIPLLAPIPTAWMVGTACTDVMDFPFLVALPAALVVEGLGFVSINLANRMREFNRHLNAVEQKQQMRAPVAQAWMISGLYVVVVLLMTVLLHIFPELSAYAPIPFIFMAVAGGWLYALSSDQGEREAKWSKGRVKRPKTDDGRQTTKGESKKAETVARKLPANKVDVAQLLAYLARNPGASDTAIARNFGVSRQAIAARRRQLTPQELGLAMQEEVKR